MRCDDIRGQGIPAHAPPPPTSLVWLSLRVRVCLYVSVFVSLCVCRRSYSSAVTAACAAALASNLRRRNSSSIRTRMIVN